MGDLILDASPVVLENGVPFYPWFYLFDSVLRAGGTFLTVDCRVHKKKYRLASEIQGHDTLLHSSFEKINMNFGWNSPLPLVIRSSLLIVDRYLPYQINKCILFVK